MIPLNITVEPTRPVALTSEDRARYLGTYQLRRLPDGLPHASTLEVFEGGGRLRARVTPALFDNDAELDLVPAGKGRFAPGWYRGGKFFDVEVDMVFVFTPDGGPASAVEFRGLAENIVFTRGERVK